MCAKVQMPHVDWKTIARFYGCWLCLDIVIPMEKKTASDMRAYLSSFEPEYPVKKGYIARLIVNEKLATVDICRKIKNLVQAAELDMQIHQGRVKACINDIKRNAAKKMNYTKQWADLVNISQQPFCISFLSGESLDSSGATSASVMQSDHTCASLIQPDHTCVLLIQNDHTTVPLIQSNHSQNTSETPGVEVQSKSINNESPSVPVLHRSPSPKRLRKDCDNCVAKQRTSLNMLKENKHLRFQMRALRVRHREEKKQMSLKMLNMTKKKSESATHWRTKYTNLKKQLKEKELPHKTHEMLITTTSEEERQTLEVTNEKLQSLLNKSEIN